MARQVLENGVILPAEYSDDWYDDMTSNLTKLDDVIGSDSEKLSSADVGAAALSNNYNDLDNLPTIPTVNDATLTIQKNGVDVQTFTANASSNVTCNITVPTKTSDLTNDSNFVDTSNSAVASGITSAKVTAYDTHIADTDIHVTTADKTKWNNGVSQAYVLRYASTSVTPSSTISYSVLNNTDNIKAGDSVIDSAGQVFLIASVDSANQTVTVSAVLLTLALDANVMHLSGNETVAGIKTFSDFPIFAMFDGIRFRCAHNSNAYVTFRNANQANPGSIIFSANDGNVGTAFHLVDKTLIPYTNGDIDLGTSLRKWKSLNGINPGSLSMPDLNNGIDISSYITVNGGNKESLYTPPANGWVSVRLSRTSGSFAVLLIQGGMASSGRDNTSESGIKTADAMLPVVGGVQVSINSAFADSVVSAYFYPCLGNV